MAQAKTPLKAARGYAHNRKALPRLEAAGLTKRQIYEADRGETWEKISMRSGECLGVVDGLRAFGNGKREITKAVNRFHDQGATVLDVETGRDSRTHGHMMFDAATGPRCLTEEDRKILAEERASRYRKKHGMVSKVEAHKIWHTVGPSVPAKEAATGWSRAALYAAFGKSGAPAGRRPKDFVSGERDLPPPKSKPVRPKGGFVYFMRIGGRGPVKIGFARSIRDRFSSHRTSNPREPVLVAAMRGTMKSEQQLHSKFSKFRLPGRREWFRLHGDLKKFVEALPKIDTDLNG